MDEKQPLFTQTFTPGPILECLTDYLPIASLRNLQLTCRQYAGLYEHALPTKWKIDKFLSRWLRDPKAFRHMLDKCNAIVSGSAALHFFDQPINWQPADMDVYAHDGQAWQLHSHLLNDQDYVYNGTKTAEEAFYPVDNISEVRTYSHLSAQTGNVEKIQIVCLLLSSDKPDGRECRDGCIGAILNGFHSTVVVNYLTGTEAVSLFPQVTFVKRKMYLKLAYRNFLRRPVAKYVVRGFPIAEVVPREHKLALHPLRQARFVGDKLCWSIVYGSEGVSRKPQTHPDPFSGDSPLWWTMGEREYDIYHPDVETSYAVNKGHCYTTYSRGRLTHRNLNLYRLRARLSAGRPVWLCNCEGCEPILTPWNGRTSWREGCVGNHGGWSDEAWRYHDIETVGSCAPYNALLRMADEEVRPYDDPMLVDV